MKRKQNKNIYSFAKSCCKKRKEKNKIKIRIVGSTQMYKENYLVVKMFCLHIKIDMLCVF